jgi:type IV pilus assembly protein PilY1
MKIKHLCAISLIMTFVVIGNTPILAMDTDIYLKAQTIARDDQPNVLLILDNSGSMHDLVTTRPAYDSTIDYCTADLDALLGAAGANAGKPASCASIAGRIYRSFGSNPPSYSSDSWFSATKNKCFDSLTPLASSGKYTGAKVAKWKSGATWGSLSGTDNGDITYVDCQPDGTTNGQAVGDGTYPRNNNSNAYTNVANRAFNWSNFTNNTSPTLYTSNYMNYWHNAGLVTSRKRLEIAKDVVKSIIDSNTSVRFGLMIFNDNDDSDADGNLRHGGRMAFKIDTMTDARRTAMKSVIDNLVFDTHTPLAETLWEGYRYFGGLSLDYGDNNPALSVTSLIRSGTTVTVTTSTSHRFSDGYLVTISGANQSEYNGTFVVNVTSSTQFTYDIVGAPATPGTGTIRAMMYRDTTSESGGNYISPYSYTCQRGYIIYVTDGDPTKDTNADAKIATRIGTSCDGSSCLDDLAGWMYNNDVYSGIAEKQTIITHTISFGAGISASGLALLQETATQGGGSYNNANDADELSSALQGAIAKILEKNTSFSSPSLSVNAFNRLYNRDEVYFALFKPSNSCNWDGNVKKFKLCTNADIAASRCNNLSDILDQTPQEIIDSNSKIIDGARSYWSAATDGSEVTKGGAGANVPSPNRTVYTYNGSYSGLSASSPATPVVEIKVDATNPFYTAVAADPTVLGMPSGSTSTDVDNLVSWIRGQDSYDKYKNGGEPGPNGVTTDARWAMGDPLHSRPVAVTYGGTNADPIIKLFVGTNDGMVRMISNATGVEQWAFLVKEMYNSQYPLSQDADQAHIVGLDVTPTVYVKDVNLDGIIDPAAGDRVYLYIGMRRGGRNIYAFDVTPSATVTSDSDTFTPKLMWVIQGGAGDFAKLGQTWSRPILTRLRFKCTGSTCDDGNPATDDSESRTVLVFAGGYDTNQDNAIPATTDTIGNAIYVVDPLTGSRIWWASNSGATLNLSKMKYSIPSDVALVDTDGDGSSDRLYVGDTGGQLWRIDFGDQLANGTNGGTNGYVFADVGCTGGTRGDDCASTAAQYKRKFFYPPDVAQVKDTTYSNTSRYDLLAIGSGDREDPLDLLTSNLVAPTSKEAVHNRIYAFRDYNYATGAPATIPATPVVDEDGAGKMYDATANNIAVLTGAAQQTEIDKLKDRNGYFIDLKEASAITVPNGLTTTYVGEKVLARAAIFEGVIHFTTFTPANDVNATTTCSANEGVAKQYALDAFTAVGAADFDKDGDTERSAQVGGGIPSEVVIIFRPDGTSGLIGTSGGAAAASGIDVGGAKRTWWYEE